jgi:hypothetical protein
VTQKRFISRSIFQMVLIERSQHSYRIVTALFPEAAVETAKEIDGVMIPCPSEIKSKLTKSIESGGEFWDYCKCVNWFHVRHHLLGDEVL